MYQQSVDRSHGSSKSDLILLLVLVAAFFSAGAIVFALESRFTTRLPRYIFIGAVLLCLYLVYRLRLVGYRYTVFYEAPKPVFDEKLGETIIHEDYPYPLGTVVFERIVSAKGTKLFAVDRTDIIRFAKPGEACPEAEGADVIDLSCRRADQAHALVINKDGRRVKVLIDPDEEFARYLGMIMDPSFDPSAVPEEPVETE